MSAAKPAGLRVVLDTNVYISAFTHFRGAPFRIWRAALDRRFVLLTSPAIMTEIADVLRNVFHWEEGRIVARLKLLAKVAEIVVPSIQLARLSENGGAVCSCDPLRTGLRRTSNTR